MLQPEPEYATGAEALQDLIDSFAQLRAIGNWSERIAQMTKSLSEAAAQAAERRNLAKAALLGFAEEAPEKLGMHVSGRCAGGMRATEEAVSQIERDVAEIIAQAGGL